MKFACLQAMGTSFLRTSGTNGIPAKREIKINTNKSKFSF